ncbi:MAG: addiction module toxin RelE [Dehalococcoidia bacterium]|nr:MAG: addiction module toxin RelE [Dehalococcoidia bacterium]
MPRAWTANDERQYKHVKTSERQRGRSAERADEIAARTVNKQRREEGRTPNSRTQGTGNPRTSLDSRSIDELRNRASQLSIAGQREMGRDELVAAIRRRNGSG